jgi:hypothetical protein
MIGVATEETDGSDRVPDLKRLRCEPGLERHFFNESEMALFSECMGNCAPNLLDTADIVRDAMLPQLVLCRLGRTFVFGSNRSALTLHPTVWRCRTNVV